MALRAVWIIPAKGDAETLTFSRFFPTVEERCKSRLGDLYVRIPPEKEFIKALFVEVGLRDGGIFVECRDRCDKQVTYPAFQVPTNHGVLWPVVVLERNGHIFCALPFEEKSQKNRLTENIGLTDLPSVPMALEVLNGLAACVGGDPLSQGSAKMEELRRFVTASLPFGRPVCCDPALCLSVVTAVGKGNAKLPAWNPMPHKGKSVVSLHVKEQVSCVQWSDGSGSEARTEVWGSVNCRSEVEGVAPEASLVLSHPSNLQPAAGSSLLAGPGVFAVEPVSAGSTRLRFHPASTTELCCYRLPTDALPPPVVGSFSFKEGRDSALVSATLRLQEGMRNSFKQMQVRVPLPGVVMSVRSQCSQGSLAVEGGSWLVWNAGSKLPSGGREASMRARVKIQRSGGQAGSLSHSSDSAAVSPEPQTAATAATVVFRAVDSTYSGVRVDAQSIVVSTAPRVSRSSVAEVVTGSYKIWSKDGPLPALPQFTAPSLPASVLCET